MTKTAFGLSLVTLTVLLAAYGCSNDAELGSVAGTEGGSNAGGASGSRATGGGGGAVGSGGFSNTGGGSTSGGSIGAAGAASGGSAVGGTGIGGTAAIGGIAGTAGTAPTAGTAGTAGAAGTIGSAGTAGTAGAAGAMPEDPRCASVATTATLTAHLKITADNECDVYVNGASVGQTMNWGSAVTIDVSLFLHPGRKNMVAVVGRNTSSQAGNDRGIIGELTTTVGTTRAPLMVTNKDWRVSLSPGTDWTAIDFDDSAWPSATEVANDGDGPWGSVLGNVAAKWIWFAPIPVATTDKPNLEATYTRRMFYLDFSGQPAAMPLCAEPRI